eukprot:UN03876
MQYSTQHNTLHQLKHGDYYHIFNIYGGHLDSTSSSLSDVAQAHANFLQTGVYIHILTTGDYPIYYAQLLRASSHSLMQHESHLKEHDGKKENKIKIIINMLIYPHLVKKNVICF